jgi:hypothetical protein
MTTALVEIDIKRFGAPGMTYNVHGGRAVVFLDDARGSEFRPGTRLTELLLGFGDVFTVNCPRHWGFGAKKMARGLSQLLKNYDEVVLIGLGATGGLLAYDVTKCLKKLKERTPKIHRILVDAAAGYEDLRYDLRKLAERNSLVPLWWPLPRWWSKRHNKEAVSTNQSPYLEGQELVELEYHREAVLQLPYRTYVRRMTYVANHPNMDADVLKGSPAVYIQSTKDSTSPVRRWAYDCWETLTDGELPCVRVEEDVHCGILEFPTLWCDAFSEAFKALGLTPLPA